MAKNRGRLSLELGSWSWPELIADAAAFVSVSSVLWRAPQPLSGLERMTSEVPVT